MNYILVTWVKTASRTSPLKGLNTIALYLTGYKTKPSPGWINPAPTLSIVVTAITNPYFPKITDFLLEVLLEHKNHKNEKTFVKIGKS